MPSIVIKTPGEPDIEVPLTDAQQQQLDAHLAASGLTPDQWFEQILREFLARDDVKARRRRPRHDRGCRCYRCTGRTPRGRS